MAAGLLALAPLAGGAKPPPSREQRQQLQIRDRQFLLEQRRDLQAAQDLRDKGFLSAQRYRLLLNRFREAQLGYNQAKILLEQTKLELLKNPVDLVVVEARKYPSSESWSMVDITLENQAEPSHTLVVNPAFSPEEIRNQLRVENVYVSLRKRPIIGEPFELWVPALEAGERQVLTFRLLQETADIAVSLRYLDAREEQPILFKQNRGQALLALEETRLDFLREATHVAIRQARVFRTAADRHEVEITLENASQVETAMAANPQQSRVRLEAQLALQNLVVSLRNPAGLLIAEPYQFTLPQLALGESQTLRFSLLEDCQSSVVSMQMPDGRAESSPIALRPEALHGQPQITTPQSSREAELNTKVSYQLIVERLAEDETPFTLIAEGLPAQIGVAFLDPATEAEVN